MLIRFFSALVVLAALFCGSVSSVTLLTLNRRRVPGQSLGISSDSDLWRFVRTGNAGSTQMKDELAAVMIQSEGDNWRAFRNGPLSNVGAYSVLGIIGLLVIFYFVRGRIRIDADLQAIRSLGLGLLIGLLTG